MYVVKPNNMIRWTNGTSRKLMKAAVLLMTLTAVVARRTTSARQPNLNMGSVGRGDRLIHRSYVYKTPIPHSIQTEDVYFRGTPSVLISAVQANEVGQTQYGHVFIIGGGVDYHNVSIRFISARGWGYYYVLELYGRDNYKPTLIRIADKV